MLELPGRVQEIVGVRLGSKLARVGFLNKVFVALLLGEVNGVLLALEVDVSALHEIARRLPADQRVLPSVSLGENVPVHSPASTSPVTRLCSGFGLLVDAIVVVSSEYFYGDIEFSDGVDEPNCSSLELHGSA